MDLKDRKAGESWEEKKGNYNQNILGKNLFSIKGKKNNKRTGCTHNTEQFKIMKPDSRHLGKQKKQTST